MALIVSRILPVVLFVASTLPARHWPGVARAPGKTQSHSTRGTVVCSRRVVHSRSGRCARATQQRVTPAPPPIHCGPLQAELPPEYAPLPVRHVRYWCLAGAFADRVAPPATARATRLCQSLVLR